MHLRKRIPVHWALVFALALALALPGIQSFAMPSAAPAPAAAAAGWQCDGAGGVTCFWPINSISMVSATEGWAVGRHGIILHLTGGAWQRYDAAGLPTNDLLSVSMDSATDGWAIGVQDNSGSPTILHYNGTAWIATDTSTLSYGLASVAAISATEAIAVGPGNIILHYDGASWNLDPVPALTVDLTSVVVARTAKGIEGWAVGTPDADTGQPATIYYYLDDLQGGGGSWDVGSTLTVADLKSFALNSVAMSADGTEVWAVGANGTTVHLASGTWGTEPAPSGFTTELDSVVLAAPGEAWAVGGNGSVLHFSGGVWTEDAAGVTGRDLAAVAMASPTDAWASGGSGTILHLTNGAWSAISGGLTGSTLDSVALNADGSEAWAVGGVGSSLSSILHYTGGHWVVYDTSSLPTKDLESVAILPSGEAWAVGLDGTFLHKPAGGAWATDTVTGLPTVVPSFNSVSMSAVGPEGWAVGTDDEIFHYLNGKWQPEFGSNPDPVPGATLMSVWAVSNAEAWAVGTGGTIIHYSGSGWTNLTNAAVTSQPLSGVAMVSPTEGWAIGSAGTILHYTGASWTTYTANPAITADLTSLAMVSPSEGWATGLDGSIYHYNGTAWSLYTDTAPGNPALGSVAVAANGVGRAVGDHGALLEVVPAAPTPTPTLIPTITPTPGPGTPTVTPTATPKPNLKAYLPQAWKP